MRRIMWLAAGGMKAASSRRTPKALRNKIHLLGNIAQRFTGQAVSFSYNHLRNRNHDFNHFARSAFHSRKLSELDCPARSSFAQRCGRGDGAPPLWDRKSTSVAP